MNANPTEEKNAARPAAARAVAPLALAALLTTVLVWATAFVGIRSAMHSFSPLPLALLRFATASAALGAYAFIKRMRLPAPRDIPLFLLSGLLGITVYNWALNLGEHTVAAGVASFLISTAPVFTTLFSILVLRERTGPRGWAGLFISLAGIGIIAFSQNAGALTLGVPLILLASLCISVYNILQRRLLKTYTALEATTYSIWGGTLFLLFALPGLVRELPQAAAPDILTVVYLGVFPAALGYILWGYGLSKVRNTGSAASFMYLTPVLTLLIGWLFLREIPGIAAMAGGAVAIGGMVLVHLRGASAARRGGLRQPVSSETRAAQGAFPPSEDEPCD